MAVGFGLVAQLVAGRNATRWMWLIGAGTFFVASVLISEAWRAWATEAGLQPNHDGLSFDEIVLAILPSIAIVIVTRHMIRRHHAGSLDSRL
jgi:hypothetical protein